VTRAFDLSASVPEFAAEAAERVQPAELSELLAELSVLALSEITPSEIAAGRARLLHAVSSTSERLTPFLDRLRAFFDLGADALREIFARAERESEWEPGPLPWVSLLHFSGGPSVAGFDTGFVRLKQGSVFPPHRHTGLERVLILSGSYRDHEQRRYGPGDRHDMSTGSEHALYISPDEDVWLAVILEGQIQVVGVP